MLVQQAMTRDPKVINPSTTIADAARMMKDGYVGALPVGENDKLVGVVTDRDIALRGIAEGKGSDAQVSDVMSEGIYYCYDDVELAEAARMMAEHQVQRVPVVNRDKRLVGILATADLARNDVQALASAMGGICEDTGKPRN